MPSQIISTVLSLFSFYGKSGPALVDFSDLNTLVNLWYSSANNITAHAGGGQAAATPLATVLPNGKIQYVAMAEVDTVVTANDSVLLPMAIPGTQVDVINATATSMQVFGQVSNPNNAGAGDTIAPNNSNVQNASNVGVAQAGSKAATYICTTIGQWKQLLSN